jgi:hypothetical protein
VCAVVRRPRVMPYRILILSMSARMIAEPSGPSGGAVCFAMMILKWAGGEGRCGLRRIRVSEDWPGLSEHDRP